MKKAILMLLTLMLILTTLTCAFASAAETAPVDAAASEAEGSAPGYRIAVTDQDGKGVAGVYLNFCSDAQGTCMMGQTDENGEVFYEVIEDIYHIQLLSVPEGYSFDREFEVYTEDHSPEPGEVIAVTIQKD